MSEFQISLRVSRASKSKKLAVRFFVLSKVTFPLLTNPNLIKAKSIGTNILWQVDLIDVSYLEKENKHSKYFFNCVDVYSRYY